MTLVSRPFAGPGWPDTALDVLADSGWTFTQDEKANTYAFPADRRLLVEFLPEANLHGANEKPWAVRAYDDLHRVAWEATFTDATPAELIAAFLADLVKPEPLDPDREIDEPPASGTAPAPAAADTAFA